MISTDTTISIVLFDFGGVIAEEGFKAGLAAIARANGLDAPWFIQTAFEAIHSSGYVFGKASEEAFWRELRHRTGVGGPSLRDEILSRFTIRPWMLETAATLRRHGIRTGILSDQTDWLDLLEQRHSFSKGFDPVFNSYHMGTGKRDPNHFPVVARHLGIPAGKILLIDDDPGNCDRARQAGWHAIQYEDRPVFTRQLASFFPFLPRENRPETLFDLAAATWDRKPERVRLAENIAAAMVAAVPLSPDTDVLDFGCGTGLLTLALQPYVRTVTGADLSLNMVEVLQGKVREQGLKNVRTVHLGPEGAIALDGCFHLIVSAMTFHHIHDIPALLRQFHEILLPGGLICVADLEEEGGRFHTSNEGVFHFGFDPSKLAGLFGEAGFDQVVRSTAATVEKLNAEGVPHTFPVFLMKARKPS